jgi:hypothetical protein
MDSAATQFELPEVRDYGSLRDLTGMNSFGPSTDGGLNIPGNPLHHGPSGVV